MIEKAEDIARELEYNFNDNRRYYSILLIGGTLNLVEQRKLILAIERKLSSRGIPYESIDFFKEVVTKGEVSLGDTGNSFNELIEWINRKTVTNKRCILIYEIDPLLSTWKEKDVKAFFKKIIYHDGIRMPVLIVSPMADRFDIPINKTGQGLVIRYDEEGI